eukprot:TRINITY_DN1748_c0_g1_i3.p1 TRINITY_DN1748_c0_g1~~TRINITY_DN1748_c0_g1_i3.p1  ORF type:complete len:280 (-),score=61.19 TRINITY_DN1748_c0_g1_i3:48-887(-)
MSFPGRFCALAFFAVYCHAAVDKEESCNVMGQALIQQTNAKGTLSSKSLATEEVVKAVDTTKRAQNSAAESTLRTSLFELIQSAGLKPENIQAVPQMTAKQIAVNIVLSLCLAGIAALVFRKYQKIPAADESVIAKNPDLKHWSSGPFDCFADMPICLWSCCCPAVRWAGNMEMVGLLTFWAAFGLFMGFEVLGMAGISIGGLAIILMLTYFRNKIRVKFGMEGANECGTVCGDCVFVCCCSCCAISQEARHLKLAAEANHEAVAAQRGVAEAPAQAAI